MSFQQINRNRAALQGDNDNAEVDLIGGSPLDHPIWMTHFPDARAQEKAGRELTLRNFAREVPRKKAATKGELPFRKLARFGAEKSEKGCLRTNSNMLAISGVEGDYDGGVVPMADAADTLRAAGVAALFYSTASSTPEFHKWRVMLPLSEELPVSERVRMLARVNGALGGILDPASFTPSQSYYFGGIEGRPDPEVMLVDGGFLDKATDLDATAIGRAKGPVEALSEPAEEERIGLPFDVFHAAVMAIPNVAKFDGRGEWLGMLAGIHHETRGSDEGRELAHKWSATWDGGSYNPDHTDAAWDSFRERPGQRQRTGASIIAEARKHGWREPDALVAEKFDVLAGERDEDESADSKRLILLTPGQCANAPSRGYILKGMLAPHDVGCIYSMPGVGKSLIAPHLGYKVAQGEETFGMRTRPGGVLYVAAEDPLGMQGRVTALRAVYGDADDFALVTNVSDLASKRSGDLMALLETVAERKPALIVIDTLAMAFPGIDENAAEGMRLVVSVARKLTEHGAAVLLLHHTTQADGPTPRGHSVLNGALDMALKLERSESGIVRGKLRKNRNGSCERDIAFRIDVRTIGTDHDGDPITAANISELSHLSGEREERLSPNQATVLAILSEMTGVSRDGVEEEAWRAACIKSRRLSGSDREDSHRKAMDRAVKLLVGKRVAFHDGRAFLIDPHGVEFDDLGGEVI